MKPLRFGSDAQAEYDDAADVYLVADPQVARDFRAAVVRALRDIRTGLLVAAKYPGSRCRQWILPNPFPYSLIYADEPTVIRIIAVAHHSRRPGYWKKRLRRP